MLEQPTRYILLQRGNLLVAFLSMQLVDEEGGFVLYCYEVQVDDSHQGQGLGKWLMDAFHLLAQHHRLARTMLTCFSCNTRALAFYKALGYELDSTSPEPRRLRNKLMQPDYQILTRVC
ncbi:acyl-CoA N-acyltransferase, partial [Protomyces lactucae-debilis]